MMERKAERSSAIPATNQQSAFCFSCAAAHHSYKYRIPYSFSVYILYFTVYTVAAESTTPLLRRGLLHAGFSLSPASPQFLFFSFSAALSASVRMMTRHWKPLCFLRTSHTCNIYKKVPKRKKMSQREGGEEKIKNKNDPTKLGIRRRKSSNWKW
jgi:hypothetical protein